MPKRILQGVVVSDKQDKTVTVKVERRFTHPVLKKTVRRTKNYHAHDENNVAKVGQVVSIEEARPFSKTKTWKLIESETGGGIVETVTDAVGTVTDAVGAAIGKVKSAVGLG